jgi:hypothetical protein
MMLDGMGHVVLGREIGTHGITAHTDVALVAYLGSADYSIDTHISFSGVTILQGLFA